jgi:hypothetical protein
MRRSGVFGGSSRVDLADFRSGVVKHFHQAGCSGMMPPPCFVRVAKMAPIGGKHRTGAAQNPRGIGG